jgi:plastocyanin
MFTSKIVTMNSRLTLALAAAIALSLPIVGLSTTPTQMVAHGQENATTEKNETMNMSMNMTNMNLSNTGTIPSLSTPGEETFYVFTTEIPDVDEEKLKVAGDAFSVNTLVTNKGDMVTVKFYNVDEVQTERHSFTIGDPYKVNIDVGFSQNGNATFTADNVGVFPFYCKYHLPVMMGQLVVLP